MGPTAGPETVAPQAPPDPFARSDGRWVFESVSKSMGHQLGERVADQSAGSGAAWAIPTAPHPGGVLVFGPYYKNVPSGKYQADFYLKIQHPKSKNAVVVDILVLKDAAGRMVKRFLGKKDIGVDTGNEYRPFSLDFELPSDLAGAGVEFRVSVLDPQAMVYSDRVEVQKR